MQRIAVLAFLGLLAVMAGCKSWGSDGHLAVINVHEVVTKSNIGIRAVQEVKEKFADRHLALKQQEAALKQLEAVLRVDPSLEKRDQLQRLAREYAMAGQQLLKDEAAEKASKYQPVVDQINKVVAAYAKEKGLLGIQDSKAFAYVDPSLDITAEIIRRINQAS